MRMIAGFKLRHPRIDFVAVETRAGLPVIVASGGSLVIPIETIGCGGNPI